MFQKEKFLKRIYKLNNFLRKVLEKNFGFFVKTLVKDILLLFPGSFEIFRYA